MYIRLFPLLSDYWNEFIETTSKKQCNLNGERIVPVNSIPIVWHGDINHYINSDLKILTVSINPHPRAFDEENPQFDMDFINQISKKNTLNSDETEHLFQQFNQYYERNRKLLYNDTVFKTYEKILNEFDASYLPENRYLNQALHVDMLTPLVTNPTWSKLKKTFPSIAQGLQNRGKKLFRTLMEVLNPDLLLISVQKQNIIDTFEIDDQWESIIFRKDTSKKNDINAILYTNERNQHILYGQYNLYGKRRKVFGYASDSELENIINNVKQIVLDIDEEVY